ncbi:MAG: MauE/DoxX family redox-associated membrane protein [Candidatus Latescibacterota bacterium]
MLPSYGFLKKKEIVFLLRVVLGILFILASIHKVQHPEQLAITVRLYEIIPAGLSNIFALFLAWSELIAGAFLVLGIFSKQSAMVVAILLTMFIAAIVTTLIRGLIIDCGCFDEKGDPVDSMLLFRNLLLLGVAYLVMQYDRGYLSVPSLFSHKQ